MLHPETNEFSIQPRESPFIYFNPETLVNEEMQEWLARSRIAHIAPLWLPLPRDKRRYGGAEDVAINNITALSKFGAKEQLIFGHPGNEALTESVHGAKVFIPNGIDPNEDLLALLRADRYSAGILERVYILEAYETIADQGNVSVIHDHTNFGRELGNLVSQLRTPVIRTEHGPLIQPYGTWYEEHYLRYFENRKDMGFVSISHAQQNQIPNLNWVGTAYNGVDLRDFEYREEKDDYLLFLGRVCRDKGTHNAIQVARTLGMKLVIAGAVEETPESIHYFEKEVKPFIDSKQIIHFDKGVNAQERKVLLSNAGTLLMLVEWEEPFGMVMAEALASGTPIVGFRRGSVPEIVQENTGFVVDTLTEAMDAVKKTSHGDFSAMKCRELAEKYFSKEAMTARYIRFYMEEQSRFLGQVSNLPKN